MKRREFMKLSAGAAVLLLPRYVPAAERANKNLSFAVLSDLHYTRTDEIMARYREQINALRPDFVVLNGDNINDDAARNKKTGKRDVEKFGQVYERFAAYLDAFGEGIRVYPVLGNHDFCFPEKRNYQKMIQYLDGFTPFTQHHEALVKQFVPEAPTPLYYSWDLAGWHFASLPCGKPAYMKRIGFYDWLEKDLAAHKDMPTVLFMHVPALSVGMCDNYFTEIAQKRRYLELFTRYGNVRLVLAGHVHNGTKVAIRSARKYKGTTFIVCPTRVPQRQFGAYEYHPQEDKFPFGFGFLVGELGQDDRMNLFSMLRDGTRVPFPAEAAPFTHADNPVNFQPLTALPATAGAATLDFEDGLSGWHKSYEYIQEPDPSVVRQASTVRVKAGKRSGMLMLKGLGCPRDFSRSEHSASLYRLLPLTGRIGDRAFEFDYLVDSLVWPEPLDKSKWETHVREWRMKRYSARPYRSLARVKIAFIRNNQAVADTDVLFGRWGSKLPKPHGLVKDGMYVAPQDGETVVRELKIGEWQHCRLTFAQRKAANQTFDKVLVVLGLQNDGLLGHEMKVFFDNLRLERV